jgi:hypothetical protein
MGGSRVSIVDELHAWTLEALATCTESQRAVYLRVHGISEHGGTNSESAADVARSLDVTRQTAHDSLNAARLAVYRHISLKLIARERQREDAIEMPVPGITTLDKGDAHRTMIRYGMRSEQRVNLGPGSQAMENVERKGPGASTDTMRIRTHQKYTQRDNT